MPLRGARIALAITLGFAGGMGAQTPATRGQGKAPCLHYEPELVRLSGVLEKKTFNDANDKPEAAWIVRLFDRVCTTGPGDVNPSERDVREVQLVARGGMLDRFAALAGKPVSASGTLFHSQTAHHHTKVLLAVKGLVEGKLPAWAPQTRSDGSVASEETETPAASSPPPPPISPVTSSPSAKTPAERELDVLVAELSTRLTASAARDLASVQDRWRELADQDCRFEVSLSGGSAAPGLYASCMDRARRERIARLRALTR